MILDLTIENLLKSGCNTDQANELYKTPDTYILQCNEGNFYVSKSNNKFYTDIDFYRMTYFNNGSLRFPLNCPNLASEYFDLSLTQFLQEQKETLGMLFDEKNQFKKFILNEIERTNSIIKSIKEYLEKMKHHKFKSKEVLINVCESYIDFLEAKALTSETHKQIKKVKPKKTLLEFIHNITDKEAFSQELKNLFPTEQGKSIKAIILKLVDVDILIYGTKEFLQFYNELRTNFNRDIGTYQSINDVKTVDKEITDIIHKKLNPLIIKYKTI